MTTIYQRLSAARVDLQKLNLKKSGRNAFAGFDYYELCDFIPSVNSLCDKYNLSTIFQANKESATLTIVDALKPELCLTFEIPFEMPAIKGANAVQNLGGAITYLRRYLFMIAFEIVESDVSDAVIGKDREPKQEAKKELPKQQAKNPDQKVDPNIEKIKIEINKAVAKKMKELGDARFKEVMAQEEITSICIKDSSDINWLKSVLNIIQTMN